MPGTRAATRLYHLQTEQWMRAAALSTKRGTNMSVRSEFVGLTLKCPYLMHGSGETPVKIFRPELELHELFTPSCLQPFPTPALINCCKHSAAWILLRGLQLVGQTACLLACSLALSLPPEAGLVTVLDPPSYWLRLNASSSVFLANFSDQ